MTRLLVSVTDADSAAAALADGADIVDLSDTTQDATAPVSASVLRSSVQRIAGRVPLSAGAGDLAMPLTATVENLRQIEAAGMTYATIAIPAEADAIDSHAGHLAALIGAAARVRLIAVFRPDSETDLARLPGLARGCAGAMLELQAASSGGLLNRFDLMRLHGFVTACRSARLIAVLGGALEAPDVPRLLLLSPDLLATSTAPDRLKAPILRSLISRQNAAPGCSAPQGQSADRVIVEDLVLPASIGTYAHERSMRQRVRFSVTAAVLRAAPNAAEMHQVFSYDLITDGIRLLIASQHFPLVETLAERIAELVLGYHQVIKVTVRVEKLDTGSGRVGVEIERGSCL